MAAKRRMKRLTTAQVWAVLEVVFSRRAGICLTLDQLKVVGLYTDGRHGTNAVTKALVAHAQATGSEGYFWPLNCYAADDLPRLAFIAAQRSRCRASRKKGSK